MTRVETGSRLLRHSLHPYQHELGAVLDLGVETTAIQWPRREGKTTTVWDSLLGRCIDEPDTQVLTTAQTGVKARDRFMAVARTIERRPSKDAPKIYRGAGHEAFEWSNGSRLWVTAPKPESVRGEGTATGAFVVYIDEPQELDPQESLDLQQAVMPLFDTVPDGQGQIILSGTPGTVRAGWFWNALEAGKAGKPGYVSSIHAAEDGDDWEDEAVWLRVHRGIGTLTTIEKMRSRRAGFDNAMQWAMEYLGVWPGTDDGRAIDEKLWAAGAGGFAVKPSRFGLAFDTSPDSSVASLMAAWRDADELPHIELLMQGEPRAVAREAHRLAVKHKLAIAYDAIGANLEVAEMLERSKPKPKTMPLTMKDVVTAEAGLMSELRITRDHPEVTLRHPNQPALNDAAEAVAWRTVGDSGQLFGRRASAGDITAIVGASIALLAYDRLPVAAPLRIVTRKSA